MPELSRKTKALHAIKDLIQKLIYPTNAELLLEYGRKYNKAIMKSDDIFLTKEETTLKITIHQPTQHITIIQLQGCRISAPPTSQLGGYYLGKV